MPDKKKPQDGSADPGEPEPQAPPPAAPAAAQAPGNGPPAAPAAPDPHARSPEDLAKGYARPYRDAVVHAECKLIVVLRADEAAMFARSPGVLGKIACPHCRSKRPVSEFTWRKGGQVVGT